MATAREDVAIEGEPSNDEGAASASPNVRRRLKRGPVEIRLPERDQIPAERLDAAYWILVRLVARQVRHARREEAANDQRRPTVTAPPESGKDTT